MAEYSKMVRGNYTSQENIPKTINLPFAPQQIMVRDITAYTTPTAGYYIEAYWDYSYAQNSAMITYFGTGTGTSPSTPLLTSKLVTTGGIQTFNSSLSMSLGPQQAITGSSYGGGNTTFTVANHNYGVGDVIVFEGLKQTLSPVTGLSQMCGMPFSIISITQNTFTVAWNTSGSNFTQLSSPPAGSYVRKVLNPFNYFPGSYFIAGIAQGAQTTITTSTLTGLYVGSTITFRIPNEYGITQLNGLTGTVVFIVPGVTYSQFIVNIDSTNFTPFTSNVPISQIAGLSFPQCVATGDINYGGSIPVINGIPTINGPSVDGAFVNNTRQGFTIGLQAVNAASHSISWEAYYYDESLSS
tara:strand:- start:457 stop:1521 length:1065 start_codon:yes stop_codon:yes gene_type:complete